jgi:sporulation protein YlmC with PRC-barrel domain
VRGSGTKQLLPDIDNLPRMSDVIGHKMLTRSGRLLGAIDDILINGADGTIIGFVVGEGVRNRLENIFNPQRSRIHGYVRADADLQVGNKLIIVPDDALIEGELGAQEHDHKPATETASETEPRRWGEQPSAAAESSRSSIWTRRRDGGMRDSSPRPDDTRFVSEIARPVETNQPVAQADTSPDASPTVSENEPVTPAPEYRPRE